MIRGVIPSSLLDWPGALSSVIFLGGCNWLCEYCHNRDLPSIDRISFDDAMLQIAPVKDMIDHIIISGGEPTLWKEYLEEMIVELRVRGYKVGLHTNGSNPQFMKSILPILDFVGMDIKGGEEIYSEWIHGADIKDIETSVRILQLAEIDYEFRTTIFPPYFNDKYMESFFNLLRKWRITQITVQQFVDSRNLGITAIKYGDLKKLIDFHSFGVEVFYRGFDKFIIK